MALIRESEENAVKSGAFSLRELMLRAGSAAAEIIMRKYGCAGKRIAVVCGKGNNGGDGCVIAEILARHGADVTVVTPLGEPKTENAAYYYGRLCLAKKADTVPQNTDIVVDALFGIGLDRPLEGAAAEAVKACLQSEGNILEAMSYFTCLGMGTFDDLNINSEFSWEPLQDNALEEVVNNEIDIKGTKNLKTYFISAKMCRPETAHLMEIKYFSEHFGIDGQAVLVTSNSKTAGQKDGQAGGREERSRLMGVKYINRPIIDEGKLGETLNAIIEEGEKERI